jgi:5-formyltetrahydrofolate cyclo-ligase
MKHRLRGEMKAALAAMAPEAAAELSLAACRSLLTLPEYARARSVMLYAPIAGEVDCRPVAVAGWKDGKTVLLPRVTCWSVRKMVAVPVDSLNHPVVTTRNGLREPDGEPWPVEKIDMIVVPGLAYDRHGNRLGRGGGFYDRFLARPGLAAHTCGLAFSIQVVGNIPVHPNDYPVKVLVTDKEVLRFSEAWRST